MDVHAEVLFPRTPESRLHVQLGAGPLGSARVRSKTVTFNSDTARTVDHDPTKTQSREN